MSRAPVLTAAIIALNEARNLAELLPRLDFVDEIVVVDGGSTDGALEIAHAHGARTLVRTFDTFAAQRNAAIDLACGAWVLSIDADERPGPRLAGEIRRRIAAGRHAAYRVGIRSTIFGRRFRASGTQDDRPIRLFRRDAARWSGEVHEVLAVRGRVGRLDAWLEHGTLDDLDAFLRKMHRYTALAALARARAGVPPRPLRRWMAPPREVFRRLVWKAGVLDGPAGWAFCLLSGLSEWVLAARELALYEPRDGGEHCPPKKSRHTPMPAALSCTHS